MSVRKIINVYLCPKNSRLVMEWNIKIVAWFDVSPLSCSFRLITFHLIGNIFDCPFFFTLQFLLCSVLFPVGGGKWKVHISLLNSTFDIWQRQWHRKWGSVFPQSTIFSVFVSFPLFSCFRFSKFRQLTAASLLLFVLFVIAFVAFCLSILPPSTFPPAACFVGAA